MKNESTGGEVAGGGGGRHFWKVLRYVFRTINIFVGQHNKIASERSQYIFNTEEVDYFILKLQYIDFATIMSFQS